MDLPILSIVTFLPLVGAAIVLALPKDNENLPKMVAFITTLAGFVVSLPLVSGFDAANTGYQFVEQTTGSARRTGASPSPSASTGSPSGW